MTVLERRVKYILLFVAFTVLGTALAVQFRTAQGLTKRSSVSYQMEALQQQLDAEKQDGAALEEQIAQNEKKSQKYLQTMVAVRDFDLEKEWEQARVKAGLTDVSGAGVILTVNDATVVINKQLSLSLVHDIDLVKILNELRKAGAEALSINGERIMAVTAEVCMGPTIRINGRRYLAPFEIKAIGDVNTLYDSISVSSIVKNMKTSNITFSMQKQPNIIIRAYNAPAKKAVAVTGGTKE